LEEISSQTLAQLSGYEKFQTYFDALRIASSADSSALPQKAKSLRNGIKILSFNEGNINFLLWFGRGLL
jgi:hypothetical protein